MIIKDYEEKQLSNKIDKLQTNLSQQISKLSLLNKTMTRKNMALDNKFIDKFMKLPSKDKRDFKFSYIKYFNIPNHLVYGMEGFKDFIKKRYIKDKEGLESCKK